MSEKFLPMGFDSFEEIIQRNCVYVDKTNFIVNCLEGRNSIYSSPVLIFNRPRRFGKSLNLSTLASFLDIRKDSKELFAGLEIMNHQELVDAWMNKWPVLSFSFKNVRSLNEENIKESLRNIVIETYRQYDFLLESPRIANIDRIYFQQLESNQLSDAQLPYFASKICSALYNHFGKKVFVIIDEYDVPLSKTAGLESYDWTLDFVRTCLDFLKGGTVCQNAVLGGCLRLAGESLFTGLNNFRCYGVRSKPYAEDFGFTDDEVEKLLRDYHLEECYGELKEWYDGYQIGGVKIFNPWDVMNYINDKCDDPASEPAAYWSNTASATAIETFMFNDGWQIKGELEELFNNGVVNSIFKENLTYASLFDEPNNIWTFLYCSGYLTEKQPPQPNRILTLGFPNREIKVVFSEIIDSILARRVKSSDMRPLYQAFFTQNEEQVSSLISAFVGDSISYFDFNENFYHAFVAGLFAGFNVKSNLESGNGRPDLVILNGTEKAILIIEIKYVKKAYLVEDALETALKQIRERDYAKAYRKDGRIIECALVFHRKDCFCKFADVS